MEIQNFRAIWESLTYSKNTEAQVPMLGAPHKIYFSEQN